MATFVGQKFPMRSLRPHYRLGAGTTWANCLWSILRHARCSKLGFPTRQRAERAACYRTCYNHSNINCFPDGELAPGIRRIFGCHRYPESKNPTLDNRPLFLATRTSPTSSSAFSPRYAANLLTPISSSRSMDIGTVRLLFKPARYQRQMET